MPADIYPMRNSRDIQTNNNDIVHTHPIPKKVGPLSQRCTAEPRAPRDNTQHTMHAYTHTHTHSNMLASKQASRQASKQAGKQASKQARTHTHTHTLTQTCTHASTYTHIYIHAHSLKHARTQAHTRTHAQTCTLFLTSTGVPMIKMLHACLSRRKNVPVHICAF
jgi:hypothetical protein